MSDVFGIGQGVSGAAQAGATIAAATIQADAASHAADLQYQAANEANQLQTKIYGETTARNKPFYDTGVGALGQLAGLYGLNGGGTSPSQSGQIDSSTYQNTPAAQAAYGSVPSQPVMTWQDGTQAPQTLANWTAGIMGMNGSQPGADQAGASTGQASVSPVSGAASTQPAPTANNPFATFWQSPDYQFTLGQGIRGVDAGGAARGMLDSGATRKAEIAYAGNLASGNFNTYANRLQALAGIGQGAANNTAAAGQGYANSYGSNISNAAANAWANGLNNLAGQFRSSYSGGGGGGYSGPSAGGINGIFSTGGTFGPAYTGDGNGEW
jgi:hypothetical protein